MKYTVIWSPEAEQALAALWLHAPDRAAVTAAAYRIDQRLTNDPDQQGAARSPGVRILVEPPLAVLFEVSPLDRIVRVFHVWLP
jgi:hypothetical protein